MIKVCYVAPLNDSTGYSVMANDTILALDAAGIDVVPRSIKLATQTIPAPAKVIELTGANIDGVTHVIQHILPPYFVYHKGYKNIGYFHVETSDFISSGWQFHCNLMDELWVSSEQNKEAAIKSGVTKPIKVVNKPVIAELTDRTKYKKPLPMVGNRYVFYHIGDYSIRKNTINLIKAYLEEFDRSDHVVLILKSYVEGVPLQQSAKMINEDVQKLKQSLRKGGAESYPPIILISDYVSIEEMWAIHAQGNCFVSMEKGAAWNIPAFDAISMGNMAITSGWGGQTAFIEDGKNGFLVPYRMESVYGAVRCPYPTLYSCKEQWSDPDPLEFKRRMRICYENKLQVHESERKRFLQKYSPVTVGNQLKEIL